MCLYLLHVILQLLIRAMLQQNDKPVPWSVILLHGQEEFIYVQVCLYLFICQMYLNVKKNVNRRMSVEFSNVYMPLSLSGIIEDDRGEWLDWFKLTVSLQ